MRMVKISTQPGRTQRVIYLPGLELRLTHSADSLKEEIHTITVGDSGRAQVRMLHWESTPPKGINNNQLRYGYDDLIGSSGLEIDSNGQIISLEEYYPYGGTAVWTARNQTEAAYKTIRYSGKERDATGLYYYGYRYYQPWAGRWLSADPAGTVDGLNLYHMVRNNPIKYSDNNGLAACHANTSDEGGIAEKRAIKNLFSRKTKFKPRPYISSPIHYETSIDTVYRWDSRPPAEINKIGFSSSKIDFFNKIFGNKTIFSAHNMSGANYYFSELESGMSKHSNQDDYHLYKINIKGVPAVKIYNQNNLGFSSQFATRHPKMTNSDSNEYGIVPFNMLMHFSNYTENTAVHNREVQILGPICSDRIEYIETRRLSAKAIQLRENIKKAELNKLTGQKVLSSRKRVVLSH